MKPEKKDNDLNLFGQLRVEKPEAFWSAQRARILAKLPERRNALRGLPAWTLAPAFAAAFLLVMAWFAQKQPTTPSMPEAEVQMLENLDMLSEMDILQKIPEQELI